MTLAIIIPTMNEEAYLPLLLKSIKKQSLQPDEIIVADAGSTDSTVKIAESYGAKIISGGMPAVGRNNGADASISDNLFFFDADVILEDKDFLKKSLDEFRVRKFDLATADVQPIRGNSYDIWSHNFYNWYVRLWGSKRAHLPGFCILVKKSLHNKIGGFDEKSVFLEDQDYAVRGSKVGKFGFLDSVKISVSVRRQERDGRLNMGIKYVLAELYYAIFGPIRTNIFNYTFGHSKK